MAKACHEGLAPSPGSANVLVRRIGTVLACVSPAGFTTVPITVSTPSASSWAIAAAARGVAVIVVAWLRSGATGQRQLAGLADVQGPQNSSHADPERARQGQVGKQLLVELCAGPLPEVFVVAQLGVLGGEPVRELGGQPLLVAIARPGAPLQRVVVELLVDAGGGSVGVSGVDADSALVVVGYHRPRELARAQGQPVAGVDGPAEVGERAAEFGG